jgi:hypothetical protein
MPEGPFGGARPFSSIDPYKDTLIGEVNKIFEDIPEWSKSSSSVVKVLLDNFEDELIQMSKITREENIEVARTICYNGVRARITPIERGAEDTSPGAKCDGEVRIADIHTHPIGDQAYPSLSDTGSSVFHSSGLPTEFNEVIIRPEKNPNNRGVDAYSTCVNFYSIQSRAMVDEINQTYRKESKKDAQEMIRDELMEKFGEEFTIGRK